MDYLVEECSGMIRKFIVSTVLFIFFACLNVQSDRPKENEPCLCMHAGKLPARPVRREGHFFNYTDEKELKFFVSSQIPALKNMEFPDCRYVDVL